MFRGYRRIRLCQPQNNRRIKIIKKWNECWAGHSTSSLILETAVPGRFSEGEEAVVIRFPRQPPLQIRSEVHMPQPLEGSLEHHLRLLTHNNSVRPYNPARLVRANPEPVEGDRGRNGYSWERIIMTAPAISFPYGVALVTNRIVAFVAARLRKICDQIATAARL